MPEAPGRFDPCGALPGPGITVLEASAGTGKTFTIAALATRLVAGGAPLSEILAVTFTRLATGELRDRVRARLVSAENGLARLVDAGEEPPQQDQLLALLATGTQEEVQLRRQRLADALAAFDSATITTTHGFCRLALAGLGVSGGLATGATLLEDRGDMVTEVVDDLFVGRALRWGPPAFGRRDALEIGREVTAHPSTPLEPEPGDSLSGRRRRLADGVRKEMARRLREANLLTYDDLLVRLRDTLADPQRGEVACARLRDLYRVVLVDEFQDTDPVQWEVVRRAFGTGATTLVLIGDPKQALYSFRDADVHAYLDAVALANSRFTLGDNWRSDKALLDAYDVLMGRLNLGHPDIPYRQVRAVPAHCRPGLEGAPVAAALRARVLHSADHRISITGKRNLVQKAAAREWVAADLAGDVVALLRSGAQLVERSDQGVTERSDQGVTERSDQGVERSRRPVGPGEVAVLVGTNLQAGIVQRALRLAGVPAVVAGTDSVFRTPAARHWLRLLEALEQPSSRSLAVAVALTPFIGMSADEVAEMEEPAWEDIHARLYRWAEVLRLRGVATLTRAVSVAEGLPGRVLGDDEGERELTDLEHVAELLHREGSAAQLGPPALRAWLGRRIDEPTAEGERDEHSRRLDSDAEAVQVLTIHRAKGLEFPIVYCPYLWDTGRPSWGGRPVVFHDGLDGNRRKLDVGDKDDPAYSRHVLAHREEEQGEDLRLAYVALTRAKHQVVIWWARAQDCEHSALGRLMLRRDGEGNVAVSAKFVPRDEMVEAAWAELAARAPGCISVERCGAPSQDRWEGAARTSPAQPDELSVAPFERTLDGRWRRTSYSGITAVAQDEVVGSEPEERGTTDEPGAAPLPARDAVGAGAGFEQELTAVPLVLSGVAGGTEVGTLVHQVLEQVDFAGPDLEADLTKAMNEVRSRRPLGVSEAQAWVTGLAGAISTPLGPLAGGARLADVGRGDRLDELGFELPLAGGDQPRGEVLMADVAGLFSRYVAPDGPLAGYPARLRDPLLRTQLRGYLTGSLDLVFRLGGADDRPRFFVADYKTNRLAGPEEPITAWHYRPAALGAEMQRAHYLLQAMLYMVALHRYLRWRLPGYDPEANLAGVLYLFVRGMAGPGTPLVDGQPCGVFSWPTPAGLVTELSDLLDGSRSRP